MKLGLLGGTFNPIHRGHLALARAVWSSLQLDRVLLIPSAQPPHKQGRPGLAPAAQRLAMARLAVEGQRWLAVDDLELAREGRSYTIDTVSELRARWPQTRLFLIVGGDWWDRLHTWRRAAELFALVELVCVNRPGHTQPLPELPTAVHRVHMEPDPISSSAIRARVRAGRPISGLVSEAVEAYIRAHHLYEKG